MHIISTEADLKALPRVAEGAIRLASKYMPSEKPPIFEILMCQWSCIIKDGTGVILYDEDKDGNIAAVLPGFIQQGENGDKYAVVWHWVSEVGNGRDMMRWFMAWAKGNGASVLQSSCHTDTYSRRHAKLYRRLGFNIRGMVLEVAL